MVETDALVTLSAIVKLVDGTDEVLVCNVGKVTAAGLYVNPPVTVTGCDNVITLAFTKPFTVEFDPIETDFPEAVFPTDPLTILPCPSATTFNPKTV